MAEWTQERIAAALAPREDVEPLSDDDVALLTLAARGLAAESDAAKARASRRDFLQAQVATIKTLLAMSERENDPIGSESFNWQLRDFEQQLALCPTKTGETPCV